MPEKSVSWHVHIGTGALGLGLVAWLGSQAELSVFLANRAGGSGSLGRNRLLHEAHQEARQYDLVFSDSSGTQPVTYAEFLFTDADRDRNRFIDRVVDSRTLLLTTALKGGIDPSLELLALALTHRIEKGMSDPLYVVACENAIDSIGLYHKIVPLLPPHLLPQFEQAIVEQAIVFVPCMVDRLCNDPAPDREMRRVQVEVERFAQWTLQRPSPGSTSSLERALMRPQTKKYIEFVDNLEPFAQRKRWLVNGPHLLIALNAFARQYAELDRFLQEDPLADQILRGLLDEAMSGLLAIETRFGPDELREFNSNTRDRFRTHPDRVRRILSRFTGPQRLEEFFKDFYRKITEPTLQYMSPENPAPFWTTQTLLLVTKLIYESWYIPQ